MALCGTKSPHVSCRAEIEVKYRVLLCDRLWLPMFWWNIPAVETCFNYQLIAQFLYSIIIYVLHYNPRHVSSNTMLILRRSR
jgi:hypothetical protein